MRLNYNQFLAVVYGDLFDWPLTEWEARMWAIVGDKYKIQDTRYKIQEKVLDDRKRERLVKIRKEREKISKKKLLIAIEITEIVKKVPTVQGIFLTGSVAVGNAKEEADIDLMIVAKPGTLWLTRFWIFVLLKSLRLLRSLKDHRDKICPNIFLDTDHLEIAEKNLYTAHEILQVKCLFDWGGVERKWLEKNKWTKKYLPGAYKYRIENCRIANSMKNENFEMKILWLTELPLFILQYLYQLPKQTNEKIGWGYAFFHPRQLGKIVEEKFWRRLVKYTY